MVSGICGDGSLADGIGGPWEPGTSIADDTETGADSPGPAVSQIVRVAAAYAAAADVTCRGLAAVLALPPGSSALKKGPCAGRLRRRPAQIWSSA